ncbi:MAG TPA: Rieske (2Fe-2S) protein [Candidatus Dormibacteraeota bacterium]
MRRRPEQRVAAYLDRMLARRRPPRFKATAEELEAIAAAAALASAQPGADLPDPRFVERLGRRLRGELETPRSRPGLLSRRALLQTAGASAAAVVVGAVGDHALVAQLAARESEALVPDQGSWRPVAAVEQLPAGGVMPVDTGSMKVLVVNDGGRIHALSGVCTHLGCTLEPDAQTGRIACPCHRSSFSLAGQVVDHQLAQPPAALPAVESRVREGQIEVFVV